MLKKRMFFSLELAEVRKGLRSSSCYQGETGRTPVIRERVGRSTSAPRAAQDKGETGARRLPGCGFAVGPSVKPE